MKKLFLVLVAGLMALAGNAQHSYLSAPGVAVFYPANYDASAHAPSPIFERELYPIGRSETTHDSGGLCDRPEDYLQPLDIRRNRIDEGGERQNQCLGFERTEIC